jgi:hypothetical protein
MRTTQRLVAAVVACAALTLTGLTSLPASADPSPSSTSATTWLSGELTNGLFHFVVTDPPPGFEYDEYGLSLDGGFAALSAGNTAVGAQVRDAVAAHVEDYITGEAFGDPGSTYAGATAKALAYAQVSGGVPTSFGGVNLVTRLEALVTPGGRLADVSTFGDQANTIGQSFGARGLTTAGSAKAPDVTAFLLKQQCPAGFFRLHFAADAPCAANTDPDTDVTAFVMLNLQNQGQKPEVKAAIDRAAAWLLATQASDGSFGGGGVTAAPTPTAPGSPRGPWVSPAGWRPRTRQRRTSGDSRCRPGRPARSAPRSARSPTTAPPGPWDRARGSPTRPATSGDEPPRRPHPAWLGSRLPRRRCRSRRRSGSSGAATPRG